MPLRLMPISIRDANTFIKNNHRHHKPVHGAKFAIAAEYFCLDCENTGQVVVGKSHDPYQMQPPEPIYDSCGCGCVKPMDFVCGVVVVGRPVARHLDDGFTAEVTRLCTDGTDNACSMLYRAAWRAAKAMGYTKIITYILGAESGDSLRASGFVRDDISSLGGTWNRPNRARTDKHPTEAKQRWSISCRP